LRWIDGVSGSQDCLHSAGWERGMIIDKVLVVAELQSKQCCGMWCYLCKIFSDGSVAVSWRFLSSKTLIWVELPLPLIQGTPPPPQSSSNSTRTCMTQLGYRDKLSRYNLKKRNS
jgi:hypothetical protein